MNILVIRFSALGDLVTREPTFRAIKHFFPNATITFLTSSIGKALYEDSAYFDEIIVYNGFFDTLKKLKIRKYEIIFNIQCTKLSHYIVLFLNKNILINKSYSLFQKIFKIKSKTKSLKDMLIKANVNKHELDIYMKSQVNTTISLPTKTKKTDKSIKSVAICTGSSKRWESKKWGLENYIKLIQKLLKDNIEVNLVGSFLEKDDAYKIEKRFPNIKNHVDKTTLTILKDTLSNVDIFIGNDSGPTHIAAGVGTSTLTIFGPTSIKHSPKFDNYKGNHFCVSPSNKIKCHPCYKNTCPTEHECMKEINVENVYSIINKFFKEIK